MKSAAPAGAAELHPNPPLRLRVALIVAAYLFAFIILDLLSRQFEGLRGIVAWYPPAGLTYALLLVFGVRFWPAVTIALLFGSLFIYRMPQPPFLLSLWALVVSLIYGGAAALLRYRIRFDWQMQRLRDVAWLVVTTIFVSALLAILSVSSSALSSDMARSEVLDAILHWWIGETVGVLAVTPFLLIYVMPLLKRWAEGRPGKLPAHRPFPRPTLSVIGQAFSLALMLFLVFGTRFLDEIHPLYLITLPLIWIALDHGVKGVTAGIVALNIGVMLAIWSSRFDFAHLGELQLLMIVNCIVGLLMAAVVTERKRGEEALQLSEKKYRTLVEEVNDGLYVTDSAGVFTFTNPALARMYGFDSPEALVGRKLTDFVATEMQAELGNAYRGAMQNGHALEVMNGQIVRPDGTRAAIEIKSVFAIEAGRIAGSRGVVRDVTERERAEQEREHLSRQVQEQATQLAQVMHAVPEGVLLLDGAGRVVLANLQAAEDLAALAGDHVGDPISHLGDRALAELLSAPPSGLWHEARAGSRIFEIIPRPIASGHGLGTWVLVLRDVTQEREVRQRALQGERLAAVGHLAAGIAHDFNNILTVIALDARLALAAPGLTLGVRERLASISGQAQLAANLVRQILDFSRRAVLERRPVALRPFLAEQIALLARTLPESIAVELDGTDDDCTISADRTRLQQVVMNLAVNARDAMPVGGRLRFTLERVPALPSDLQPVASEEDEAAAWVRLTVADSGTGIPTEALPRIFEPFFSTKGPGKGSGLGLSQIYGIVKQHGGEIEVCSAVGHGTTFTIYLPAVPDPGIPDAGFAAGAPEVVAPETEMQEGGKTILLVEDNPALLDALRDLVVMFGYRVESAGNGVEALAALEARGDTIALVLSDLVMPVMGGEELFRAMRARGYTTPVVMLSGHPLEGELAELKTQGLAGWLLKPPHLDDLARLLAQALAAPRQT